MSTAQVLDAWFARQAERERRAVRLEDALLGGQFARYFAYRLRFFALRYATGTAVQLIRVLLIQRLLGTTGFFVVAALVAAAGLLTGGWWGALEILRTRVRTLYRFESPTAVGREVARWMVAAIRIAVVVAMVVLAFLVARVTMEGGLQPIDLAIAAVLIRSAMDLPIRAYHAGAFALRRVYRPWGSILALEVLGLASILALVPLVGAWAIGLSDLAMAAAFAGVAVRYARRTHRLLGLAPERLVSAGAVFRRPRMKRRRSHRPAWSAARTQFLVAAAAGSAMSLDSLVVLATVSVAAAAREPWLAILVAGISPTIRAGFDWAQLVYFDLKRLDAPLFANLRRRLDRAALWLSLALGAALAAVGLAVAVIPLGISRGEFAALPPFVIAASVLGLSQMQAFTDRAYGRTIMGGLVMAGGLAVLRPLADLRVEPLSVLAATTVLAVVVVRLAARLRAGSGPSSEPVLPTAWLTRLGEEHRPVRVGIARVRAPGPKGAGSDLAVPSALRDWRATDLSRRVAVRIGGRGAVAVVDADHVAWFARDELRPAVTRQTVVLEATGRVIDVREYRAGDGADAMAALARWQLFGAAPPAAAAGATDRATATDVATTTDEDIERRFRALVPGGIVFWPGRVPPRALLAIPAAERRLVLWDAIRHARQLNLRPARGPWDVTAWCPHGALRLVMIAPSSAGFGALRRWRRQIREANIGCASAGRISGDASLR